MKKNGLTGGMIILYTILGIVISLFAAIMIGGLVIGSISNVATSGDVPVSAAMNTSLSGQEGDYITASEAVTGNVTIIIGLVIIVVLITVFGLKFGLGKKKGGSVE